MKNNESSPDRKRVVPSGLRARILAATDAAGILRAFADATGLTLALEDVSPPRDGHGPPCGMMSRLGPRRIAECVDRRKGLLERVGQTGDSAVVRCPVGTFCLAVPVYAMGFHVATLRAGGFTKKMGASRKRADAVRELLLLASGELGHRAASVIAHPQSGSAAVRRAMDYISTHANELLHQQDIAKAAGVSRQHLAKIWKRQVGIPMHACLNAIRIDRAKTMLEEENRKIVDTAFACGFGSLSQFNRAFLCATGVSPSHWLDERRQPPPPGWNHGRL